MLSFSAEQIRRYSRQIILPEVGGAGQSRLLASKVLLIGAGGLGSPAGLYLAGAGVGVLGIVDFDRVDDSNLQRQILHGTGDIGRLKVESAASRIGDLNPDVTVVQHDIRLSADNILDLIGPYDVVVDGSDNFPTRYLVNDACVMAGKPNVHGSIFRFDGQATVFKPPDGPCYQPPPPGMVPSCQEAGVLGALPGIVGSIQAIETIKLLLDVGDLLVGRLLVFSALEMSFADYVVKRDPDCPVCGDSPKIRELIDYEAFCGTAPEQPAPGQGGEGRAVAAPVQK